MRSMTAPMRWPAAARPSISAADDSVVAPACCTTLTRFASHAKDQTGSAAAASDDTASNVNTVASASEELTASIQEIARHVTQATTVVREAGATTESSAAEIEGLAAAGQRIGAVI